MIEPNRASKIAAHENLTIDKEPQMNVLSGRWSRELAQHARQASVEDGIRAVVLTGAGDKAFCAGADLKEREGMSDADMRTLLSSSTPVPRAGARRQAVFIAALNGAAFGGGTELALACDLRVAAATAELGLTEMKAGHHPRRRRHRQRLAQVVGFGRAKEMILSARRKEAQ